LGCRILLRCREHAKADSKSSGRFGSHASELAPADHPHNWGAISLRHWLNLAPHETWRMPLC
jgi:hypothetical protein